MDFENINLAIKVEPPMEGSESENNSLDILSSSYIKGVKLEADIIEQMESVKVEKIIFDLSYSTVFGTPVDIKQERKEALLTEGFHAFENTFDHSSFTVLEDALNKSNDLVVKQSGVLVKTESSEIDIKPDIADEYKIKHEEVYIKEEDKLETEISSFSGSYNQEKYDDYKKHKCHVCDYKTKRRYLLKQHLLRHKDPTEVNFFSCDKCEHRTRFIGNLKRHLLKHENLEEVALLKCDKCEYKTSDKSNLRHHNLRHKSSEEVDLFRCDKCEYQTNFKGQLKTHLLRHKSIEEVSLYSCYECEFQTRYKNNLRKHVLRHKNRDEFALLKCDYCEYKSLYGNSIKRHSLQHKKPEEADFFKCDKCKFKTIHKYNLKLHYRRHEIPEELKRVQKHY